MLYYTSGTNCSGVTVPTSYQLRQIKTVLTTWLKKTVLTTFENTL